MKTIFFLLLLPFFYGIFRCEGAEKPDKAKFYLYLLLGQSNMAGRGFIEAQDKVPADNVLSLNKAGEWVPAIDPIHFDKSMAGVGPGRTFGILVAKTFPGITVGLIPCAYGGSPISSWQPGAYHKQTNSHPYDDAVKRAKSAMKVGTLKAILWHQGESDCRPATAALYEKRLTAFFQRFKKDINAPDVPIIIGQLGQFGAWDASKQTVNKAHVDVTVKIGNGAFVKSDKLSCNPDGIHFNAASQREFGRRYFESYMKVVYHLQ